MNQAHYRAKTAFTVTIFHAGGRLCIVAIKHTGTARDINSLTILDVDVWVIITTRHISSPTTCLRRIFGLYCSIAEQRDSALMCVGEDPQ